MIVTAEMLRDHRACTGQIERFKTLYPDGMPVTLANLRAAQAAGLDVGWGARLLPPEERDAYNKARRSLWAAYEEAVRPLWAIYNEARVRLLYDCAVKAGMAEEEA